MSLMGVFIGAQIHATVPIKVSHALQPATPEQR